MEIEAPARSPEAFLQPILALSCRKLLASPGLEQKFPDPARKQRFEVLFPVGHFWSKIVTSKKLFDFCIERWRSPPATISPLALHKDIREDIMAATQPVATVLEPDIRAPIQQLAKAPDRSAHYLMRQSIAQTCRAGRTAPGAAPRRSETLGGVSDDRAALAPYQHRRLADAA